MISDDRLRWVLDVVQDNLDQPDLTGEDLAGRAYLSRYHCDPAGRGRAGRAAHRLTTTRD